MGASPHLPLTVGREGGSDRASCGAATRLRTKMLLVRSRRKVALVAAVPIALALLAGCNDGKGGVTVQSPPSTSASPSPMATASSEQAAILGQYRTFWASLTAVSRMPPADRRAALEKYTVDPELKSLLTGMARTDSKGQMFYGADVPRATQASVAPDGLKAVVNDCQDSTNAGSADKKTARPVTVGVARNHVVVTMQKTVDVWKVYFVSYTKTPC
jgi:hypothetical protein